MQMLLTKIVAFVFGLVTICDSATETSKQNLLRYCFDLVAEVMLLKAF